MWMENANGLLIPDFLLGVGQTGTMSMIGPLVLCLFATFAIERFWSSSQELQNRIKQVAAALLGAWVILPFLFSWIFATFSNGFHFPWNSNDSMNHIGELFHPLGLMGELVFLGIVFAPVLGRTNRDMGSFEEIDYLGGRILHHRNRIPCCPYLRTDSL